MWGKKEKPLIWWRFLILGHIDGEKNQAIHQKKKKTWYSSKETICLLSPYWNATPNIHNLKQERFILAYSLQRFQSAGSKTASHGRGKTAHIRVSRKQKEIKGTGRDADHAPSDHPPPTRLYFQTSHLTH